MASAAGFWKEWEDQTGPFRKIRVTWRECPRISAEFVADEVRAMGHAWVDQEYNCLFTAMESLVYPDWDQTHVINYNPIGKPCGGIDWGWSNPFAAIWGVRDHDDVLWIQDERYLRETSRTVVQDGSVTRETVEGEPWLYVVSLNGAEVALAQSVPRERLPLLASAKT